MKSRCLGLIGGVGVGAAVHYYGKLAGACKARGRTLEMVMIHAETSRVLACVQANDRIGLAEYLNGFIERMRAAGAEIAAIPSVTTHFCIRELAAISALPLIDIFQPLARELAIKKVRRVSLFGTRFVIESNLFGHIDQVEFVVPRPEELEFIHKTYLDVALSGKGTDEQRAALTAVAHTILSRDKVDLIIFAGTDLVLLFDERNTSFPYLDCAELHIQAIVNAMLGESSSA